MPIKLPTRLFSSLLALFALAVFALSGCAGGKDSLGFISEYTGIYKGSSSRVTTNVVLSVASNGSILGAVSDSGVVYTGSANTGAGSALSMNLVAPGAATIRLTGFFAGSAATGTSFNGGISNVTGGFSVPTVSLAYVSDGIANPFAGTYSGTINLDPDAAPQGTFSLTLAADGKITGTCEDNVAGSYPLTGQINKVGVGTFSGQPAGGAKVTYTTAFVFENGEVKSLAGTWESGAGAVTGKFSGATAP